MISAIKYYQLIKRLPLAKCPEEVINRVLQECDFPACQRKVGSAARLRERVIYGIGCAVIICIIAVMSLVQNGNSAKYCTRIAANSRLLARQLTDGANFMFPEKTNPKGVSK